MFETEREKLIYIACLMDTEGYIRISRRLEKNGLYTYIPMMGVSMQSKIMIDTISGLVEDGNVLHRIKNKKDTWTYTVCANGLRKILPKIIPFLQIKHEEANLIMRVLEVNKHTKTKVIYSRWDTKFFSSFIKGQHAILEKIFSEYKLLRLNRYPTKA